MVFKHVFILPILLCVGLPLLCVITYVIALKLDHIQTLFPYISDTGTLPPEHCVFGLFVNVASVLLFLVCYIRYRHIRCIWENSTLKRSVAKLNTISLYVGVLSSFGLVMVANFQETNVPTVHVLGAWLCFGAGCIYQWLQVLVSFAVYPNLGRRALNIFRIVCSIISTVAFPLCVAFGLLSAIRRSKVDENFDIMKFLPKWKETDVGYTDHLISSINEWILMVATMLYLLTFVEEFKRIHFEEPEVVIQDKP